MSLYEALTVGLGVVQSGISMSGYISSSDAFQENVNAVVNAAAANSANANMEGLIELHNAKFQQRQLEGMNKASIAASGGNLSGSAMDSLMSQDQVNDFNNKLILYKAGLASRNALINAKNDIIQLTGQQKNNSISTTAALVNTAASTYFNINNDRYNKAAMANAIATQQQMTDIINTQARVIGNAMVNSQGLTGLSPTLDIPSRLNTKQGANILL